MSNMGYHYGPCRPRKGWAILPVIIVVILIAEIAKHHKGVETGIEDVFIALAVIAGCAGILALISIVTILRLSKPQVSHHIRVNERVAFKMPEKSDNTIKEAFRAWLKLDAATQCSPEWDWLTNLNDGNRAIAQARLEEKVIISTDTRGDKQ